MVKLGPEPADIALGRRIRLRRMTLGMSQGALGDALNLTFQQVQKYEKGTNKITFGKLIRIAHALETTVALLTEGLDDGAIAHRVISSASLIDAKAHRIGELYSKIKNADLRHTVYNLVEQISAT